jgi:hypothetical protein
MPRNRPPFCNATGFLRLPKPARLYQLMKRIIFGFGVLGLIGCFLPLMVGLSWFELRHFDQGWTVWLVVAAFALPTYVGAARSEGESAAALVGTACFGYLTYKFGTDVFDLVLHASIGGIMMGVAVIGGLASSLLALSASRGSR